MRPSCAWLRPPWAWLRPPWAWLRPSRTWLLLPLAWLGPPRAWIGPPRAWLGPPWAWLGPPWAWLRPLVGTDGQTDGRNFSPFYRTSSPTGAAAHKWTKSNYAYEKMGVLYILTNFLPNVGSQGPPERAPK